MNKSEFFKMVHEMMDEELANEACSKKIKEEESDSKYQEFFKAALTKFGADSPDDLDDAKKKEFFAYIEKNWTAKDESIKTSELKELIRECVKELNEDSFKGRKIHPKYLSSANFGDKVTKVGDLNKRDLYFVVNGGMDEFHGDMEYAGLKGGEYLFKDAAQGSKNDILFSLKDLKDAIKSGDIYDQF